MALSARRRPWLRGCQLRGCRRCWGRKAGRRPSGAGAGAHSWHEATLEQGCIHTAAFTRLPVDTMASEKFGTSYTAMPHAPAGQLCTRASRQPGPPKQAALVAQHKACYELSLAHAACAGISAPPQPTDKHEDGRRVPAAVRAVGALHKVVALAGQQHEPVRADGGHHEPAVPGRLVEAGDQLVGVVWHRGAQIDEHL